MIVFLQHPLLSPEESREHIILITSTQKERLQLISKCRGRGWGRVSRAVVENSPDCWAEAFPPGVSVELVVPGRALGQT